MALYTLLVQTLCKTKLLKTNTGENLLYWALILLEIFVNCHHNAANHAGFKFKMPFLYHAGISMSCNFYDKNHK